MAQTDPTCQDAELNGDAIVDQVNVDLFIRCMSGSRVFADPACAN